MRKLISFVVSFCFILSVFIFNDNTNVSIANADTNKKYFTVYSDESKQKVLFLKVQKGGLLWLTYLPLSRLLI